MTSTKSWVFDPPVHMRPHEPDPSPLWTSACYCVEFALRTRLSQPRYWRESYRIRGFPCFPWNRQSAISSRQVGTFFSSRGSSKRGFYFTYYLLYSAHHYPIPYSFTSPEDWRRVKFQERVRNRG